MKGGGVQCSGNGEGLLREGRVKLQVYPGLGSFAALIVLKFCNSRTEQQAVET